MIYNNPKSISTLILLLVGILIVGCGDEAPTKASKKTKSDFSDCKYGKPEAIFSAAIPQITAHSFNIHQREGIELVKFDNGITMELIQSGCDNIVQAFKFRIPGDHRKKSNLEWVNEAVKQLRYLGGLDQKFASLSFWGNEIEQINTILKLGSTHDIQQGFKVKIDKVLSINESILLLELSQ